jgi:RNA polymerase sigma-70 factor (ECF subfamily)
MCNETFKSLVNQYSKLVYTVCYRLTNDYQESENLTQETFLTAFKFRESFIGDNYKAWLVKIASNKCKDFLKSAQVRRTQLVAVEDLHYIEDCNNPLDIAVTNEEKRRVREACESLKEPYRTVARLYYLEEKSFEEVSSIQHTPVKTVQT